MRLSVQDICDEDKYSLFVNTIKGVPYHYKSRSINNIVGLLSSVCGGDDEGVKWFCTNLGRCVKLGARGFSVKLSKEYWTGNECNISSRKVNRVIDSLERKGYIDVYTGYLNYWEQTEVKKHSPSLIIINQPLVNKVIGVSLRGFPTTGLENEVVVKNRCTKEKINIRKVVGAGGMKERIKKYNSHLANSNVKYEGVPVPNVEYFRSFIDNEEKGGRLYVAGGGVQILPQEVRKQHITIDDEPVIELDYSSMHPNILYEQAEMMNEAKGYDTYIHHQLGKNFKPYNADLSELNVDWDAVEGFRKQYNKPNYDPVRNFAKMVLLLSINTGSIQAACGALGNEVASDMKKVGDDEKKRKYFGLVRPLKTKYACEQVMLHNVFIEDMFYKDIGIYLQRVDSDIISIVVDEMLLQGETILCYHDSALVREGAEGKLRDAMLFAWKEVLGDNKFCYVDKK